jgi:transcription termination factor NusB
MLFLKEEIPAKVSLNEAIELSKTYWDDSSKKIVNWILNNFYKNIKNYKKLDLNKINSQKSDFQFFK